MISRDINHIRSIERSGENDRSSFQSKDLLNVRSISEIDGMRGLNSDTSITRSLSRNREGSIQWESLAPRRRVCDHISRVHVVEHNRVSLNRTVMEVM